MKLMIVFVSVLFVSLLLPGLTHEHGGDESSEDDFDENNRNSMEHSDEIDHKSQVVSDSTNLSSTDNPTTETHSKPTGSETPTTDHTKPTETKGTTSDEINSTTSTPLITISSGHPDPSSTPSSEITKTTVTDSTETTSKGTGTPGTETVQPSTTNTPENPSTIAPTLTTNQNTETTSVGSTSSSSSTTTSTTTSQPTTKKDDDHPPTESSSPPTWAIALIAIFLSFAAFFTFMYFLRKYLLRKRRADRQRLLGQSQEGFFMGNEYGGGDNMNL